MKKSILFILLFFSFNFLATANSQISIEASHSFSPIMEEFSPILVPRIQKLKRQLLKNLVRDKLISSKKEFVKIDLPEGKIIINGKSIEGKLYKKYNSIFLNHSIKHGEKRGIEISPYFIKVGDFYDDCFSGHASGTVELKICDDEKNSKSLFIKDGDFNLNN